MFTPHAATAAPETPATIEPFAESIEQMLTDDARDKARNRPKPRAVGKVNPRRVRFPGDSIDRRTDPRYQNGPVLRSKLDERERILLKVGPLPSWEDFRRLRPDEQRRILQPLVQETGLTDRQIAEMFGPQVTAKDITNRRQSLGLRKYVRKEGRLEKVGSKGTGDSMQTKDPARSASTRQTAHLANDSIDDIRMRFSVGGRYTAEELSNRLMGLATLLSDSGFAQSGYLYEVQIKIVETNDQVKAQQPNNGIARPTAGMNQLKPAVSSAGPS